ncbi:hypothetical protein FZC78_12305 [Rossellomorea vietnamensis]|uniref:Uncharacterized protein n=1 Tax=Rossellomorea vietnamensis TaxID=218284 RepID=A0A5D4NS37_9BACI|nr:hypothetical protein [Rossellomorea vietnamensis]TYS16126.1 hypothetical protein FZC78_12305 [Rossellomorea vietnamensis]
MKRINKNSIPFILLSFIHIALFIFTLYKKRDRKTITLLFSNVAFAYIFEYVVFNVLQSYRYNPEILKKRQLDNALGALLSQAIYIPITGTALSVFRLGWPAKFLAIIYFHLIELYFLKINNYRLHWWKPLYTSLLLPVFFAWSDYWNRNLHQKNKLFLWFSTYLSLGVITKTLLFVLDIFKKRKIGIGMVHTWKEHFLISPLYMFICSGAALLPAVNNRTSSKAASMMIMAFINLLLLRMKIINSKTTLMWTTVQNLFMIFLSPRIKSFIFSTPKEDRHN